MGPDDIPAEIIKLFTENQIELTTERLVTLPSAKECNNHRTISLMSPWLEICLKIRHQSVFKKLEQDISSTGFGFRNAMGTKQALSALNVLGQVYGC